MTVGEIASRCGFEIVCGGKNLSRECEGIFCCDLLSWAMGRAHADCAWITVIGNTNAIAVAILADCACLILAENAIADEAAKTRAASEGVPILRTELPEFLAGLAIHNAL